MRGYVCENYGAAFRLPDLGEGLTESEIVTWRELDGNDYAARVPSFYFLDDVPVE